LIYNNLKLVKLQLNKLLTARSVPLDGSLPLLQQEIGNERYLSGAVPDTELHFSIATPEQRHLLVLRKEFRNTKQDVLLIQIISG